VEVVDGEQCRPALGEIRSQPEEPVQRCVGDVLAGRKRLAGFAELEEWRSESGCADEEPSALVFALRSQTGLEELTDDAIGEVPFELAPSRAQHLDAVSLGTLARDAEQARLADPGWSLEQHEHPSPLRCSAEQPLDLLDVLLSLQKGNTPRVG
jgi:hypothetical protein